MSKTAPASKFPDAATAALDTIATIRRMVRSLSINDQARVLADLTAMMQPVPAPRAGEVLGAVIRYLPRSKKTVCCVADIKAQVAEAGVDATPKEIHNAIGYLTRKGHVTRLGYGRYVVNGIGVVTTDDLGGVPGRDECGDE